MRRILVILISVLSIFTYAQDAHLSQFDDASIFYNPAETGAFENDYKAHLQYRSQWSSVIQNPYNTSLVSFEKPKGKFGFGGLIMNSRAGIGNFNVANLTLSSSYEVTNDPKGEHHLIAGIQLGLIQKSVNSNNLTYNNQYVGVNGVDYSSSLPSYENYFNETVWLPDLNFGILYENSSESLKVKPKVGIAAFHLTSPSETFLNSTNTLPMRIISTLGASIDLDDNGVLEPSVLIMKQQNVYEWNLGATWRKYLSASKVTVFAGPYYRFQDALIVLLGAEYKEYKFGFSYDVNVSSLSTASSYRGGFEISLTYSPFTGKLVPSIY